MLKIESVVTIMVGAYKGRKGIISEIYNQWYDNNLGECQYGTYYSVKLDNDVIEVMGLEDYEIREEEPA